VDQTLHATTALLPSHRDAPRAVFKAPPAALRSSGCSLASPFPRLASEDAAHGVRGHQQALYSGVGLVEQPASDAEAK